MGYMNSSKAIPWSNLISLLELSFEYAKNIANPDNLPETIPQVRHLVDFIRALYLPSNIRALLRDKGKFSYTPSATELQEAGVNFKKGKGNRLLDITFVKGVLEFLI
ncbi:unnamed protein product [Ilex paraguariensis]|uniref:Uncharacterized protein n=1 Tax=Ilex paraguariensis TaxID=185542 RepID=A0ABC8V5J9_9AQUA